MAVLPRFVQGLAHQRGPDAAIAPVGGNGKRPEQKCGPLRAGRNMPQLNAADYACFRPRDEGQPLGRQPVVTKAGRSLDEAGLAHDLIQQGLACGYIALGDVMNSEHVTIAVTSAEDG